MRLVSTSEQAQANIASFHGAMVQKKAHPINETLAKYRAWYAVKGRDGKWMFGPSKVIGYADMTPSNYIDADVYTMSGIKTEDVLHKWFVRVKEGDDLFEELSDSLHEVLARHGKMPSKAYRISILKEEIETDDDAEKAAAAFKLIYDNLPPAVRNAFLDLL
ncbi:MAG: hypothetical protein E5Y79_28405 [Mesorhizobium sp.]|uniref:hypothetical protein n=1 Tax=Mesorhizobium sp. TaxID=1871066 RepID=UPI0012096A94|nr:hypothetical protein [Mesorhizobium sp.]TIL56729.1 MAG: hypothetical protein E5Y79_28405 [Mesorhizobium sp.]